MTRATIAAAAVTIVISLPFATLASVHPLQQQLQRQLDAAEATQDAAEQAEGRERQRLIGEHLQMMQQALQQMQATKPQAGTSLEEHQEWVTEQQKLLDEALQQMIEDQELLMEGWR